MPYDALSGDGRITLHEPLSQGDQRMVLKIRIGHIVTAFQLNSQRKVVAVFDTAITTFTGMPRAIITTDKLSNVPLPVDQKMRRNLEITYGFEIWMTGFIEAVLEKGFDKSTAKLPWWETDIVYNQ